MGARFRLGLTALASMALLLPTAASASGGERGDRATTAVVMESTASATDDVRLHMPSGLSLGDPVTQMSQVGSIPVDVGVSRTNDGQARVGTNLWNGRGVRFPSHSSSSSTPPRAVLRITHKASSGDPLAPRGDDFSFGIYFKKDARSTGTAVDNGDNLIQRGLASDSAQFKLEVDSGRPECTVKGDRGRVVVRSSVVVDSRLWYRAICSRTGDVVRLVVKEYRPDGTRETVTSSRTGATGSLVWAKRRTPLSVGGKLAADGAVIRSATDQFNGWVTHPVLNIGS